MQKNECYITKNRAAKIAGTEKVSGYFFVRTQKDNKSLLRLICSPSLQSKMKSDTYIPQRGKSAANKLKSACLHHITKTGCKDSTLFNIVLPYSIAQVCKFAIQPKKYIGLGATERLRVQYDRTVTSEGLEQPNGLGFQATERFEERAFIGRTTRRISVTRTININ